MITFNEVSLSYEGTPPVAVLKDCSFKVEAGESVAIIGPSGSGKTSILLLLAGLERHTSGQILLDGRELSVLDANALADWRLDHLGIIFQSFHLLPGLTALGNVRLPMEIAGRENAQKRAVDLLQQVGLGHRLQHYPALLSGGEKQRVAIARALANQPKLILGDEPTGNLDRSSGKAVLDLLFRLHEETGTTLVLVTHDLDVAARCQRTLQLNSGRIQEKRHSLPV